VAFPLYLWKTLLKKYVYIKSPSTLNFILATVMTTKSFGNVN